MQQIGERIRIQRVILNYSQEYMAFMLEISQAAYSNIERGKTELTVNRIFEIADIFKVSAYSLMPKPRYGSSIHPGSFNQMFHRLGSAIRKVFRH